MAELVDALASGASASSSDEIRARLETDVQMEVALAKGTSQQVGGQAPAAPRDNTQRLR